MPSLTSTPPAAALHPARERSRVVCVDDEPTVLAMLKVMLSSYDYDTYFAPSGAEGLELLATLQPVAVVVSDLRMPQMSGAQFLEQVAARYPTSVRILLTGANDMTTAVDAVNVGNLFRFLLKPCAKESLQAALVAGVALHRLLLSERDLLQRTLMGSIRALTEVLSIADPVAFGRIGRLKQLAVSVAEQLKWSEVWPIEYAALVCQIGNISLSATTAQKLYAGMATTVQERIQIEAAAKLAPRIVKQIPRLEPVAKILEDLAMGRPSATENVTGAQILRLVLAFEAIERTSKNVADGLRKLHIRRGEFDSASFDALLHVLGVAPAITEQGSLIDIGRLRAGMVTAAELRSTSGVLVIPEGVEISEGLLARLQNFPEGYLALKIAVR